MLKSEVTAKLCPIFVRVIKAKRLKKIPQKSSTLTAFIETRKKINSKIYETEYNASQYTTSGVYETTEDLYLDYKTERKGFKVSPCQIFIKSAQVCSCESITYREEKLISYS